MKSRQKSKPKQRTNWKQRALNIQDGFSALSQAHTGLISAYNELSLKEHGLRTCAKSFEKRINELERCLAIWRDRTAEACSKWESAEKHNALLLEERDAKMYRGTVCSGCHLPHCHGECMTPVRFHGDPDPNAAEEREKKQSGPDGLFTFGDYGQTPHGTFVIGDPATQYNNAALGPPPTRWQLLKSYFPFLRSPFREGE